MRRALSGGVWLASVALLAAACSGSALAAGEADRSPTPARSVPPGPTSTVPPSPSPIPSASPTVLLARQAYAYILAVQADERRDTDAALPLDVCSATFVELQSAAHQAPLFAGSPALGDFLTAAAAISSSCETRQVHGIRAGVLGLSDVSAAIADLAG